MSWAMILISACILAVQAGRVTLHVSVMQQLTKTKKAPKQGRLYVYYPIGFFPVVKIGRASSTSLASRLADHRTASPLGLHLVTTFAVSDPVQAESALHTHLQRLRVRGNGEWFYLTPALLLAFMAMRDEAYFKYWYQRNRRG